MTEAACGWEVFEAAPMFDAMAAISPEWVWGGVAIVAGLVVIVGAVVRSYGALTRGSLVAFVHWFVIAIMYFMGDPLNTGGITSLVIALYAAAVYLNIRVNFRPDGRPHKHKMVHR